MSFPNNDPGYELQETPGKGEGVFATKNFQPGELVMVGRIEKFVDKNNSHPSQIELNTYVMHAGLISKVNHSCDPNCGIKVNETGGHDFVAFKPIKIGDEITFDYAMRNYSVDYFGEQCRCGSTKCRSKITGWKDLPDHKKQEYKGFIAPYLLELDAQNIIK
ncbi:MAG: SET domain-containing methyltransferase [Crocosphaera sp.]|nr:SET domain-containing methyltransferase [Crocosphaera sp.]